MNVHLFLCRISALFFLLIGYAGLQAQQLYFDSFEDIQVIPKSWNSKGAVEIDKSTSFKGNQSLVLMKTDKTLHEKVFVETPVFSVNPGSLQIDFAAKSDLQSMDNSYQGSLSILFFDKSNKQIEDKNLVTLFRVNNWKRERVQLSTPENAVSARFIASIQKETPGKFWIDELSVTLQKDKSDESNVKRIMFTTAQLGNLLFPDGDKKVTIEALTSKTFPEGFTKMQWFLTDYWGAEQSEAKEITLVSKGKRGEFYNYSATIDLATLPLEIGRYYEIHASIKQEGGNTFSNYTSFAILPEAETHQYKPEEIPWTSRNWDNRLSEYIYLTHRLGVRICGVWGRMDEDMSKVEAPGLDIIEKLGMGYLTGSPAHGIEQRVNGWRDLLANDGERLRQGVRNFIAKYGHVRPMIVNLGNEPHAKGEDVKANVEAYRVVYEEIKKIDPSIYVVGTSIGPTEDFPKYGYGKWCDAYDFHVYEDALSVRNIVSERYAEMFQKYGHPKPVWSTELGLNSQGMARHSVAAELYRKSVNFFAGGGANMSWFGLLYPDPDGKNHDSFGSAHNVFDCRYNKYAPKLDAIAYYNAVNAIGIKKYTEDKLYVEGVKAFLFRDRNGKSLQVLYREKGKGDVYIPLKGVEKVKCIRIDGSISTLHAAKKGITLTVTEEPVLILYSGGAKNLPASLAKPEIEIADAPESIVAGEQSHFDVLLKEGIDPNRMSVKLPPFWKGERSVMTNADGRKQVRFTYSVPDHSMVREADIVVCLSDKKGNATAELSYRPTVAGALSLQLLPMSHVEGTNPSVKLVLQNNSSSKQSLTWDVQLYGEQQLRRGTFGETEKSSAYFSDVPSGNLELSGNATSEIVLSLENVDLYKVYRMKASVRDALGRIVEQDRPISAFYGVPKAQQKIVIDGDLQDAAWKTAPVRKLDNRDQFFAFVVKEQPIQDWTGTDDLSAEISYLWDDDYFYIGIKVKDDIAGKILHADDGLWQQDGLQFLIDPMRTSKYKIGKYEYSIGEGTKGIQTWCTLSAVGSAPTGNIPEIKVGMKREPNNTGDVTYEIAMPWGRLAPFKPEVGGNLGFTLIVNEDDGNGNGRDSYMTWFGNASSKDVDTVGDLILMK